MTKAIRFVAMDVHAETISVAVAEGRDAARSLGAIPNRPEAVARLVKKLGPTETLRVCYEAGPTGYVLYWQLTRLGVRCEVVAPTLVPVRAGERVKTDRRDAEKLAGSYRAGELTAVWVPDAEHEALRDLLRAREAAKQDQLRARHRLGKFLLRHGRRAPEGVKSWTERYIAWVRTQRFECLAQRHAFEDYVAEVDHARDRVRRLEQGIEEAVATAPEAMREVIAALQCLRGVAGVTAATIVAEIGQMRRFRSPRELMGYSGLVPREHSSGSRIRRGAITKTGNAHLRRIAVEAAWPCARPPAVGSVLRKRQRGQRATVIQQAWKAQHRLHSRFRRLVARGKSRPQAVTAVARELLGFVWAIAVEVETAHEARTRCPHAA
jgi:transposase